MGLSVAKYSLFHRQCAHYLLLALGGNGTTAHGCADDSRFHEMARSTGFLEWTPVPLQFTADEIQACYLERNWWYRLRRWAMNDCARAVPDDDTSIEKPAPEHTKRLQTHTAARDRDFARRHAINHDFASLEKSMQVPLMCTTAARVPYLSPDQTPGLTKAMNSIVRQTRITTAQAVRARIVIVRTVLLNGLFKLPQTNKHYRLGKGA